MKKILLLFVFSFVFVVIQSCVEEHYEITDIRFSLASIKENKYKDKQQIVYTCTSTVKDKLVFVISYYEEFVAQNMSKKMGGACYAFTPGKVIDNPLVEETFSLKFSKPFLYNEREISHGTDVFSLKEISEEIDIYENYMVFCSMGADKVLDFSQTFWEKSTFERGEYEVSFACKSSDGKEFSKTITILFE